MQFILYFVQFDSLNSDLLFWRSDPFFSKCRNRRMSIRNSSGVDRGYSENSQITFSHSPLLATQHRTRWPPFRRRRRRRRHRLRVDEASSLAVPLVAGRRLSLFNWSSTVASVDRASPSYRHRHRHRPIVATAARPSTRVRTLPVPPETQFTVDFAPVLILLPHQPQM